jgi:hypothetical protein
MKSRRPDPRCPTCGTPTQTELAAINARLAIEADQDKVKILYTDAVGRASAQLLGGSEPPSRSRR